MNFVGLFFQPGLVRSQQQQQQQQHGDCNNKHNQTQPITAKVSVILPCFFLLLSSLYLEVSATRRASWQRCKKQQHHVSGDCWGKEFVPSEVEQLIYMKYGTSYGPNQKWISSETPTFKPREFAMSCTLLNNKKTLKKNNNNKTKPLPAQKVGMTSSRLKMCTTNRGDKLDLKNNTLSNILNSTYCRRNHSQRVNDE
jgi:hypothetical protein